MAESPDGTGEDIAGDGTRGWDVSDGDVASGGVTACGGTSGGITGGVTDDDETGGALKLEGGTRGDLTTVKGDTIPEGCDAGDTTSGSGCTAGSTDEELGGGEAGVDVGVSVAAKADIIVGGGLQCLVGGLIRSVLVFAVVVVVHIATAVCPATSLVSAGATAIPTSGTARFALVVGSDPGSSFTLFGSAPLVHIKMSLNMRAISWSIALRSDTKR